MKEFFSAISATSAVRRQAVYITRGGES
jgi:hypothetical protein